MHLMKRVLVTLAAATCGAMVQAASVDPTFTTFGSLDDATFGGSGIPNDRVAISEISVDGGTLTLGLAATPRYELAPAVTDDGAGTYRVQPGSEVRGPNNIAGAFWNFSFYAVTTGTQSLADLGVKLFYDFDPAADTDTLQMGQLNLSGLNQLAGGDPNRIEGSQNLLFGYLAFDSVGIRAPAATPFDPNAAGEYSFQLFSTAGTAGINVNVAPVPLPAAGLLLIAALGGLAVARRRTT